MSVKFRVSTVRRALAVATVVAMGAVGLTACTIGNPTGSPAAANEKNAEIAADLPPEISIASGATDVDPSEPVTVVAGGEGLAEVTMTNEEGGVVDAELSSDGTTWTTAEVLGYDRTYTVEAVARNGKTTTTAFSTTAPAMTTTVALSPMADSVVGVAQTIGFRFGSAVQDRQAAQDAITVTTTPEVEGGFYWLNNQEVRWRPAEYWEPGTQVTVTADIYGTDLGDGMYGQQDNATNFTIGDEVLTEVDDATKSMSVYRNGELLRTIPISLGRAEWATPNGTYIIGDRHSSLVMDSTSFGLGYDQGGYRTEVDYATQMSYSGIFVHAAPWSVWAQGSQNTSHGCINVTAEAAQWFQNTVKRGDPVVVRNTVGPTLSGYDGLGDWNIPWEVWGEGNVNETSAW